MSTLFETFFYGKNMTIQTTGPISLGNINTELGNVVSSVISLNDVTVRSLLGKAAGVISLSDAYGKTKAVAGDFTFVAGSYNFSGRIDYGWAGGPQWTAYLAGFGTPQGIAFVNPTNQELHALYWEGPYTNNGYYLTAIASDNASGIYKITINGTTYTLYKLYDYGTGLAGFATVPPDIIANPFVVGQTATVSFQNG